MPAIRASIRSVAALCRIVANMLCHMPCMRLPFESGPVEPLKSVDPNVRPFRRESVNQLALRDQEMVCLMMAAEHHNPHEPKPL